MPYFLIGEPWTWAQDPPKLSTLPPIHKPHRDLSLPSHPQDSGWTQVPTRRQTTLNNFTAPGTSQTQPNQSLPSSSPPPINCETPIPPSKLCIWQQNIHKSKYAQQYILNTAKPEDWDIVAIQKPYLDKFNNARGSRYWRILYPSNHLLDDTSHTCSILMINSNIATDAYTQLAIPSTDITAVLFNGEFEHLSIFNIYNDCTHNDTLTALNNYFESSLLIARLTPNDYMIWLGDFNHHYPLWETEDNRHLNSSEEAIQPLLDLLQDFDMDLVLPPGIPTYETAAHNWTRPDNVWCSHHDINPIISCNTEPRICPLNADHLPIVTIIELPIARASSPPSRDFQIIDYEKFNTALKTRLDHDSPTKLINSKAEFIKKVDELTSIIQNTITTLIPLKKLSPFSKHWWTKDLTDLKKVKNRLSNEAHKFRDIVDHPAIEEHKQVS